ncbi:MAG: 3-hydroxyacyl-[acyl-carrier-protein] dehydratase FabZ [Planctomycetaceae bacterium]|nr:3-hydroxyacyl-[acyl-carrier-protein] dehydratase FabZ [Planctomycetaceae bacterium]
MQVTAWRGVSRDGATPQTAMMERRVQQTVANSATLTGRGLFAGENARVQFKPAPVNHGVVFVCTDVRDHGEPVRIPAVVTNVARAPRRTTLRNGQVSIDTCEHCLSALAGLGIDNLIVQVEGPELPAVDGSARPYVDAIQEAGIESQDQPRRVLTVTEPIVIEEGDAMIAALPADRPGMQVIYDLDYGASGPVPKQLYAFNAENGNFVDEIAPARTFVMESEAQALQARGMGKHLSAKDVLVIGAGGAPMGSNALRFDDELVRHKIVDLIGDLYLVGCQIHGRIVAYKSGHRLNHRLADRLARLLAVQHRASILSTEGVVDIRQIQRMLPHRYPMLLIDRVLELDGTKRAVGVKNVTINEPFFSGHYPGTPIMPGVLIVEAMAQLSGVLLSSQLEHTGKLAVLLSMDKVKLRRPVSPGDQLVLESEAIRVSTRTGHTQCRAYVGAHLAAEAQIKFMMVDADQD